MISFFTVVSSGTLLLCCLLDRHRAPRRALRRPVGQESTAQPRSGGFPVASRMRAQLTGPDNPADYIRYHVSRPGVPGATARWTVLGISGGHRPRGVGIAMHLIDEVSDG